MNFKKLTLMACLLSCAGIASAGTVTIKSPPEGMELHTPSGVIKHGDPDLVVSSTLSILNTITPMVNGVIGGMETINHNATGYLSNQGTCQVRADYNYSSTIDITGFEKKVCMPGERGSIYQYDTQGRGDVVISYSKLPEKK